MSANNARLMRAIRRELLNRIFPELRTADTRERVAFMADVLDYMAADLDLPPDISGEAEEQLRKSIELALTLLPPADLQMIEARQSENDEIESLRDLAARIIRSLSDISGEALIESGAVIAQAQSRIVSADRDWLRRFEVARENTHHVRGGDESASPAQEPITAESLTGYLRHQFQASPQITVESVTPVPGGRSKRTILIRLAESAPLPNRVVMRQDMYRNAASTSVAEEFAPLRLLSGLGLPVPKPVHFEPRSTELGPPFLLVERMEGSVPGTYFGMDIACPNAFLDLVKTLARLHSIAPQMLGLREQTPADAGGRLAAQIEDFWSKWRNNSVRPSPVIEHAYSWARREAATDAGLTAVVHGDCGAHNLLVQDGRLSALLDWEFMHVGDPAEDLGIVRAYSETMLPWRELMQAYRDAGGADVTDRRIRLATLLHYLKGTVLVAVSARNFAEGATDEFMKGANSYTGLRRIEMKIVEFFDQVGD